MFTGIVEEMGSVEKIQRSEAGYTMTFNAKVVLEDTRLGDSIAVNGTCLTVTAFDDSTFTVDVAPESRERTNLAKLSKSDRVNLERAVTPSTRLGGHMVQGHVDGMGSLVEKRPDREALWLTITAAPQIMRYIVPKGFICLDGVSLTVVDVLADRFTVMLVPHTQAHIVMPDRNLGDPINIEVDIVGKYVEKFMQGPLAAQSGITEGFLKEHGYQ